MKKTILLTLSIAAFLFVGVSCKKKCNIPEENTNSGVIVEAVIYPSTGGLIPADGIHIHAGSDQALKDAFKISLDGGMTQQSVNYSQYNILGYPLVVTCDAAIDREVLIDDLTQTVTFNVVAHQCNEGCDEERTIENFVVVPDFNPTYTIEYNVEYK